jgi:hypothetical protein
MLMAWIDTIKDNYPCVAPTFTQCLQWEHVEMLYVTSSHISSTRHVFLS